MKRSFSNLNGVAAEKAAWGVNNWCIVGAVLAFLALRSVPGHADPAGVLHWSGDVDDTVVITIHGSSVVPHTVSGHDTQHINVDASGSLPQAPARVVLGEWGGRGDIVVFQQPRPRTDFTAIVRIHDPQSGYGHYHFTLRWHRFDDGM